MPPSARCPSLLPILRHCRTRSSSARRRCARRWEADNTASRKEPSSGQDAAADSTETGAFSDGQIRSLNFERRKGQKNTLRTPADEPLPDSTLHEWLGSLQAEEFRRMYALDHATLVEGSESILQAFDRQYTVFLLQ